MIREMTPDDLDQVMEIEKEAFHEHWKREDFEYEISKNEFSNMKVYEKDGQVLGMVGYYILFDDAQITTLAVSHQARRHGIAYELMSYVIEQCDRQKCSVLSLEVRKSNEAAIHLYKKCGFYEMNIRKGYYEDGEDALFMMKALGGNI
ncbi:ribosomal protein S18-alanine N-acetyltransferase [uncultured Traorella sp.]|jgi:ribosomal-protein-alanine N-acetyltransferase|uniref:ribosomal protein S18-alanine N-acetyltransferase n=1 Tax=uncultured Traorella sp. TaxID=1929048 RepID=UPI0025D076C5|nr:ribosomal protein S18-alanine N-acetyltransferase [uncultured Traorella sp.]